MIRLCGLRARLLASYLLLLLLSIGAFVFVTIGALSSRPSPPQLTWQRLETIMPALGVQSFAQGRRVRDLVNVDGNLLDAFAATNDVRVMLVVDNRDESIILYDTAGVYEAQDRIEIERGDYRSARPPVMRGGEPFYGAFENPDNSEWLFVGVGYDLDGVRERFVNSAMILLAVERPTESFTSVLREFGSAFWRPLAFGLLVGGLIAFVLAVIISRSIARPLQSLARASQSVAQGQYDEQVEVRGPTEVQSVALSFNQMTAEVRAAQQSQRDFMANVSHDLKTPLTSIQGYSQAIMDGAAKDPTEAAKVIHDEAERLNRMVTQLTDLARLQAGRLSVEMAGLDLNDLLEALGERLAVVAVRKRITIEVQTQPIPRIAGDGDRLVQVFTNLISNAIKYTPQHRKIRVTTEKTSAGYICVTVADNGIGIPREDLPRIFERFYQVDKSRGPKRGTGLGLAITKEIVEMHGGRISIDSPGVNQGTTVRVWLPSPNATTIINPHRRMHERPSRVDRKDIAGHASALPID